MLFSSKAALQYMPTTTKDELMNAFEGQVCFHVVESKMQTHIPATTLVDREDEALSIRVADHGAMLGNKDNSDADNVL